MAMHIKSWIAPFILGAMVVLSTQVIAHQSPSNNTSSGSWSHMYQWMNDSHGHGWDCADMMTGNSHHPSFQRHDGPEHQTMPPQYQNEHSSAPRG